MKLTAYTDYTLRTLIYLAVNGERQVTIADIAATYRISEAHLTKVVHQLGVAGDIGTVRGKGGGIRLKRPPEHINLGAVIRRTEPDMELVPCFDGLIPARSATRVYCKRRCMTRSPPFWRCWIDTRWRIWPDPGANSPLYCGSMGSARTDTGQPRARRQPDDGSQGGGMAKAEAD